MEMSLKYSFWPSFACKQKRERGEEYGRSKYQYTLESRALVAGHITKGKRGKKNLDFKQQNQDSNPAPLFPNRLFFLPHMPLTHTLKLMQMLSP